jgi:lysophospholipase L1-like esterase
MLSLCLAALLTYPATDLVLKDGDRIVMVGGALIEREQLFGHVEVMLHSMFPDKKFTVRNLGWSGDTVWGEARAEFGTQADGYKKLVEQVKAEKPTVLILAYGTNEAFAGKTAVDKFAEQYRKLLADVAQPDTRCIFLTIPTPKLAKVSPKFAQADYDAAIKTLAKERNGLLMDINQLYQSNDSRTLTEEGILPNELGYQNLARMMGKQLDSFERHSIDNSHDTKMNRLKDPESLRQLILQKNQLYFYKYRPANDTYLFLFRKHEQGNNAAEIPRFDPLIAELDGKINELKKQK